MDEYSSRKIVKNLQGKPCCLQAKTLKLQRIYSWEDNNLLVFPYLLIFICLHFAIEIFSEGLAQKLSILKSLSLKSVCV